MRLERVRAALTGRSGDARWHLHHADETDSTNLRLLEAVGGSGALDRPWTVLSATSQTAGRGRGERGWDCPPGAGLLFSFRLDLNLGLHALGLLGHWTALALARTLERVLAVADSPARLWWKWPNDLLLEDDEGAGKLAGILVQTKVQGERATAVVGIGVNLRQHDFPVGLRMPARSLAQAGLVVEAEALLAGLLGELVEPPLDGALLPAELAPHDLLASRPVLVDAAPLLRHEHLGDGRLRLETAGGAFTLAAGELRVTEISKERLLCHLEK